MKKKLINKSVVIFCYNRPLYTKKLLRVISKYKFKNLYFINDGYKNKIDKKNVLLVQDLINKFSSNKLEVKKLIFKKNIGIRKIFKTGLDWVFQFEKDIIILEDDLIPNNSFFIFCERMLNKYRNKKKVFMVCGSNFNSKLTKGMKSSHFFSKYSFVWGWATWRDRWKLYDPNIKVWPKVKNSINFKNYFKKKQEQKFWYKNFDYLYKFKNNGSWDFQLQLLNFYYKKLSIVPRLNLISNIGILNPTGYNSKKLFNLKKEYLNLSKSRPGHIINNEVYDSYCSTNLFSVPSLSYRIFFKFKKYLSNISIFWFRCINFFQ
jgi:hypothetical protein